jgi:hypothetical protein
MEDVKLEKEDVKPLTARRRRPQPRLLQGLRRLLPGAATAFTPPHATRITRLPLDACMLNACSAAGPGECLVWRRRRRRRRRHAIWPMGGGGAGGQGPKGGGGSGEPAAGGPAAWKAAIRPRS